MRGPSSERVGESRFLCACSWVPWGAGLGFGWGWGWGCGPGFRARLWDPDWDWFGFALALAVGSTSENISPFVSGPYEDFIIFLVPFTLLVSPSLRLSRGLCILPLRTQLKVSPWIRCLFGKQFKETNLLVPPFPSWVLIQFHTRFIFNHRSSINISAAILIRVYGAVQSIPLNYVCLRAG